MPVKELGFFSIQYDLLLGGDGVKETLSEQQIQFMNQEEVC